MESDNTTADQQVTLADRVLEGLADRGVGADVSVRDLFEALHQAGAVLAVASPAQTMRTIQRLDEMDEETT